MRASIASAAALTLALAACGGRAPTGAAAEPAGAAQNAAPVRPFTGSCESTSTQVVGTDPPIVHQISTAQCRLTQLGRASLRTVQHVNMAEGTQVAEVTWTAANGELLYGTNVGSFTLSGPTTIQFTGTTTIAGGTGRFAGATGEFSAAGTANLATGAASFRYDGWIAY